MCRLVRTVFLTVIFGMALHCYDVQAETRTVLVTLRVDTAYDDSDGSVALIESIVTKLPTRKAILQPGIALSQFVLREYGFGPSDLPRSYSVLERAILSDNRWAKPEDAKAGSIDIPILPRRALLHFNSGKVLNFVPKIWLLSNIRPKGKEAQDAHDFSLVSSVRFDQSRLASQSELINVPTPISSVEDVMKDPALSKVASALDYPIEVRLASDASCKTEYQNDDHVALSESERSTIAQLLANEAKRDAAVFVLDTGWPNKDAYEESRTQLQSFLDLIWRRNFGLPLPSAAKVQQYTDPTNFHCRCIERVLREFRKIDPSHHIKVVYVPLTREQDGGSVIADLLQTSYLLEWQNGKQVLPPNDVLKASRQVAEDTVSKKFPAQWTGEQITTDKSLLDAIMLLSDAYAEMKHSFVFINESWTVSHKEYYIRWPFPLHGAVIAAAGNDNANVSNPLVDFADRSSLNKDTIAVMNLDPVVGKVCSSSFIDESDIDTAMAIGYDGKISTTICGTSFAAPRVAWLLAADEATRKLDVQPQRWSVTLQTRLSNIRDSNSQEYLRLWLRPAKLLGAPH